MYIKSVIATPPTEKFRVRACSHRTHVCSSSPALLHKWIWDCVCLFATPWKLTTLKLLLAFWPFANIIDGQTIHEHHMRKCLTSTPPHRRTLGMFVGWRHCTNTNHLHPHTFGQDVRACVCLRWPNDACELRAESLREKPPVVQRARERERDEAAAVD